MNNEVKAIKALLTKFGEKVSLKGHQAGLDMRELVDECYDDLEDLVALASVDEYPEKFNTADAMHMVLGTAADYFDTPQEAVAYMRRETSMMLPVDEAGESINIGDRIITDDMNKSVRVTGVAFNEFHGSMVQVGDAITGFWCAVVDGTRHDYSNPIIELLDEFEHECYMIRVEASETGARDEDVCEAYERTRDEYANKISEASELYARATR